MAATQIPVPAPDDDSDATPEAPEPVQLTRDMIMAAEDLPMERVEVPEWDGFVYVRTITGVERDRYENGCFAGKGKKREWGLRNVRARLAVLSVCDETGAPLFTDNDAAALGEKGAKALDRVFDVAQRLSGLSDEDVEELAKNSETTPGDCGSGESQSTD